MALGDWLKKNIPGGMPDLGDVGHFLDKRVEHAKALADPFQYTTNSYGVDIAQAAQKLTPDKSALKALANAAAEWHSGNDGTQAAELYYEAVAKELNARGIRNLSADQRNAFKVLTGDPQEAETFLRKHERSGVTPEDIFTLQQPYLHARGKEQDRLMGRRSENELPPGAIVSPQSGLPTKTAATGKPPAEVGA